MPRTPMYNETARLRRLLSNPDRQFIFTGHAREEMRNDDIIADDVILVLERGSVTWLETKKDVLWHVEGYDIDGRSIRLVIAAYEADVTVKIVTVMLI
jgi:hypothetical protein